MSSDDVMSIYRQRRLPRASLERTAHVE